MENEQTKQEAAPKKAVIDMSELPFVMPRTHMHHPFLVAMSAWLSVVSYYSVGPWVQSQTGILGIIASILLAFGLLFASLAMGMLMGQWSADRMRETRFIHTMSRKIHEQEEREKEKGCSACGEPVVMEDFKNEASVRMFKLNGTCQHCQNKM